jgi:hypothetical protein
MHKVAPVSRLPQLIPTIPTPLRVVLRNAVWAYGSATAGSRPLPDFLILGAQKAGTTALYDYLHRQPAISGPAWKEVSFFDRHWTRGERWYRGNFPRRAAEHVGEASPGYLFHPDAPRRVRELLPDAKLVAVLRDPVARAYSHYRHEVALGREPLSFEDALAAEDERMAGELERMAADPAYFSYAWWNWTYRARGLYAEQLERWYAAFPREQLLVVTNDELAEDTAGTVARVCAFIGAPAPEAAEYPRVYDRDYERMQPETRAELAAFYAAPNRRLSELLGRELAWASSSSVS